MVNKALDFGVILEKCGIESDTPAVVLKNIAAELENLQESDKPEFINYMLINIKNGEVLAGIIKMTCVMEAALILPVLLDFLLLKNYDSEYSDELINARAMCAKVIVGFKDTSAVGALLYCLNNKNENYKVRLACADALGRIGDRYAVMPLINVVQDEDEKSVYVQESATFALGMLGDSSAIDPLISIMEAKQGLIGKFSFLKERIVEALGKLNPNNKKVLQVLKNSLLDSSPMVRINAIEALMNSDYENAPEIIKEALNDEDDEVKRNALIALYNLKGRDILDEVISLPGYGNFLKNEAQNLIDEYEEE